MSSTMYDHAVKLYNYLDEHSIDGVYSGKKTDAWSNVGISQTYYSPLWTALEEMGSIETVEIGGRGRRVQLKLLQPPDGERFSEVWRLRNLTKQANVAKLQRDVDALLKLKPNVNVESALGDLALRVSKLEEALDNITKG